jgi:hypothetical protein
VPCYNYNYRQTEAAETCVEETRLITCVEETRLITCVEETRLITYVEETRLITCVEETRLFAMRLISAHGIARCDGRVCSTEPLFSPPRETAQLQLS